MGGGLEVKDTPDLRQHPALRAVIREIEAEALSISGSPTGLADRIHRDYKRRIAAAAGRDVSLTGRVALGRHWFSLLVPWQGIVMDAVLGG